MSALLSDLDDLRPVLTVADEELIRFVIYTGDDDNGEPEFDAFEVDRKEAAHILRKHRASRAYIERIQPKAKGYVWECFGSFYVEPKGPKL